MSEDRLVGQRVVVGEWDYTTERLPAWVEGVLVERRSENSYVISLARPIVVAGRAEERLVLTARHQGYPIAGILVGPVRMLLCRLPLVARVLAPLVAVNVATEGANFYAIALIYLRSLFVAAGGPLPDGSSDAEDLPAAGP